MILKDIYGMLDVLTDEQLALNEAAAAAAAANALNQPPPFIGETLKYYPGVGVCRECFSAVGGQTRRSLGHHLLHPQILRLLSNM